MKNHKTLKKEWIKKFQAQFAEFNTMHNEYMVMDQYLFHINDFLSKMADDIAEKTAEALRINEKEKRKEYLK